MGEANEQGHLAAPPIQIILVFVAGLGQAINIHILYLHVPFRCRLAQSMKYRIVFYRGISFM